MGKRIVIALGGNALGNTPYEQLALVTETAKPIVDLIAQGNEDRKSTRLNSSHNVISRMPSSA